MKEKKVCCIFNIAALYRQAIYQLMDRELQCDFFIGDKTQSPMETMDYNSLKGYKGLLNNIMLFGGFYWQKGIYKPLFSNYKIYIMIGDPFCLSNWIILLWSRLTNRKTILWTHGWYGNETSIKKNAKKFFFWLSNKILLYGDYAKSLMIEEGISEKKLDCIYNSLNYDKQFEIRKNLVKTTIYSDYFGNDNPVLFYIGRLQKVKRLNMILEAMNKLKKEGIQTNFIYIGKDIENLELGELTLKYDLIDSVWAYGPLYEERLIGEFMFSADVCVSPGNVGLTAIHCLTYGLPVITHKNFVNQGPEVEAISEHITGIFFKENDTDDLTMKIKNWLSSAKKKGRSGIASNCFRIIDERYNPYYQIKVIKSAIEK